MKSITFDKEAQKNLPEHIKAKMKEERENSRNNFYYLKKGEIIQEGDECGTMQKYNESDFNWVKEIDYIGNQAPDPQFMSHRKYRRIITQL